MGWPSSAGHLLKRLHEPDLALALQGASAAAICALFLRLLSMPTFSKHPAGSRSGDPRSMQRCFGSDVGIAGTQVSLSSLISPWLTL